MKAKRATAWLLSCLLLAGNIAAAAAGTITGPITTSGNGTTVLSTTGSLTSGHCLQLDGSGNATDSGAACGGGGGSPAGSNGDIQINSTGSFGALTPATGVAAWIAAPTSANLRAAITDEVGSGALYFVGGALGTPASGTLTNATGLPISTGVSGLAANMATWLGTPSSANLRATLTDETGTGAAVFGTSPTLSGVTLSDVTGGTQCLHVDTSGFISGTGSDCGAGGGSLTATDGTNTVPGVTSITFDPKTMVVGGSAGAATVGPTVTVGTDRSGGDYTILAADSNTIIPVGAHTYTFPQAGSAGFGDGWSTCLQSVSTTSNSAITTTTSVFKSAGNASSFTMAPQDWACVTSKSGNWYTQVGHFVVPNGQLTQMAAHTFKGNNTGSTAIPADLTATQLTAELNTVVDGGGSAGLKGLVPAPAGGDTAAGKFLSPAGWAVPPGGGVTPAGSQHQLQAADGAGGLAAKCYQNTVALANSNSSIATSTSVAPITATLTAPRTYTLAAASAVPAGCVVRIFDAARTVSGSNTATIARAGSDTINGLTTFPAITTAGFWADFASDGTSNWTLVNSGVVRTLQNGEVYCGTSNVTAPCTVSGDATIASGGAVTIANSAVTNAKIADSAVTNAKIADMNAHTIKGNNTGSAAAPIDLTATQATAELNAVVGDSGSGGTKGLVPAPASGDAAAKKYLKADGTWAATGYVYSAYTSSGTITTTGVTGETKVATCPIPAGALGSSGAIRLFMLWSRPASQTSTTALQIRFGAADDLTGTVIYSNNVTSSQRTGAIWNHIKNTSASAQVSMNGTQQFGFATSDLIVTSAINTANASYVVVSVNPATSGDSITLQSMTCEIIPPGGL